MAAEDRARRAGARERAGRALERVAKWRTLFAGWQLGTRPDNDPEVRAVKDQRELLIILRIELNALMGMLLEKGVVGEGEWWDRLATEADLLNADFEHRFPGVSADEVGLRMDIQAIERAGWMKDWKP